MANVLDLRGKKTPSQMKEEGTKNAGNVIDLRNWKMTHKEDEPRHLKVKHISSKPGGKMKKVMHEFKDRALHSGSKSGPKVTSRKQAIAIGMSEARKSKSRALKRAKK